MESARTFILDRASRETRGFTLIEMLVVLAIITIVTTITLVGHSTFDRSMLLTDAAYNVALAGREMQSFGLSSRAERSTLYTNIAYGIHVEASALTSYLLFADIDRATSISQSDCPSGTDATSPDYKRGNCIYESGDALVETGRFSRGFKILKFCGKAGGTTYCSNSSSPYDLSSLDIAFMRPDTDAYMIGRRPGATIPFSSAEIDITTGDADGQRAICFTQIGQISVVQGSCP